MELTVYNSLFTLIKDTCVLRDYAAAALLIVNVSHLATLHASQSVVSTRSGQAALVMPANQTCQLFVASVCS